jgi:copper(I)-binding protein
VHIFDAAVVSARPGEADLSFRAHNAGSETDRLLSAACACDAEVEIEGALTIAPEEEVEVVPGGVPALRLAGLANRPRVGDVITVTLTFELAGDVIAHAEVRRAQSGR